jgi:hypothetical protein
MKTKMKTFLGFYFCFWFLKIRVLLCCFVNIIFEYFNSFFVCSQKTQIKTYSLSTSKLAVNWGLWENFFSLNSRVKHSITFTTLRSLSRTVKRHEVMAPENSLLPRTLYASADVCLSIQPDSNIMGALHTIGGFNMVSYDPINRLYLNRRSYVSYVYDKSQMEPEWQQSNTHVTRVFMWNERRTDLSISSGITPNRS